RIGVKEPIARVHSRTVSLDRELSVKLIRAGLGEDFDSSVAQLVVFGGKRILVDANLANRFFRRKLSGRKSIDVNLPAAGACRRYGQRFQVLRRPPLHVPFFLLPFTE